MMQQTDSSIKQRLSRQELLLQRLDKIATELQLLRQEVLSDQDRSVNETEKKLPDLSEFRASLVVEGISLQETLLREREEQRF